MHELQFSVTKKSYFVFEFLSENDSSSKYDFVLQCVSEQNKVERVIKHFSSSTLDSSSADSNNVYNHCRTFQYKGGKEILLYSVPLVSGIYKFKVQAELGTMLHAALLQNKNLFSIKNARLVDGGKAVEFELNCSPSLTG